MASQKKSESAPKPAFDASPSMRAATIPERIGDTVRSGIESIAKQPLARIGDALGSTNFQGILDSFVTPDNGMRIGEMPGGPGKALKFGAKAPPAPKMVDPVSGLPMTVKSYPEKFSEWGDHHQKLLDRVRKTVDFQNSRLSEPDITPSMAMRYRNDLPEHMKTLAHLEGEKKRLSGNNLHRLDAAASVPSFELVDDIGPAANASGESMASMEALSRMKGMKGRGEKYVVRRGGTSRDLIGPEAVDYNPRPGEEYGVLDAGGNFRLLNRGMK